MAKIVKATLDASPAEIMPAILDVYREQTNITPEDVASTLGIPMKTLNNPSDNDMWSILEKLGFSVEFHLTEPDRLLSQSKNAAQAPAAETEMPDFLNDLP